MDKDSIYELQKIDCNCNNCTFMERDFEAFKKWDAFHRDLQLKDFEKAKAKAISEAQYVLDKIDVKQGKGMMRKANKMTFQYDQEGRINYGNCSKFKKTVTFIPGMCQIETQKCFSHRKNTV